MLLVHWKTIYKYVKFLKEQISFQTERKHTEDTCLGKAKQNWCYVGDIPKKNWYNWCYIEDISKEIISTRQQMGIFYILITDVKTEYKRPGKVNMYEVCKETSDYGKSLIKMSELQGLDTCLDVHQCDWLFEGFVMK